ncbi:CBM96 family carbohydrate-binding protein [Mangrovibacterium diazotrophicum]|nr:Ig-like domain-containing protein [Mangrovibacterium diazotrophicum]
MKENRLFRGRQVMFKLFLLCISLTGFLAANGATKVVYTLADSFVRGSSFAGTNYGTATELAVKYNTSTYIHRETYLKFDLSDYTTDYAYATLRLYVTVASLSDDNILYRVDDDSWTEDGLNYYNRPAVAEMISQYAVDAANSYIDIDLSEIVANETDGILSLKIIGVNASGYYAYSSKEGVIPPSLIFSDSPDGGSGNDGQDAYYCDPVNGSMTNPGTSDSPWASLEDVFKSGKAFDANDVIYLLNGHHGSPVITGLNQDTVFITSLEGQQPSLKNISFVSASNWKVSNLTVSPETAPEYSKEKLINLDENSQHNTIENCLLYSASEPWATAEDWLANYCVGVYCYGDYNTIRNCELKNVDFGFYLYTGADNNTIEYNTIENIGGDGIQARGSYNVFQYNTIKNCYKVDDNHDDGIQVYTIGDDGNVGTGNSVGVVIRGNTIISTTDPNQNLQGDFQGIGCFDGLFTDWVVENNVVISDTYHGISLYGAINCTVVNNTVIDPNTVSPGPTWIQVTAHKDGTAASGNLIANNLCTALSLDANVGTVANNLVIANSDFSNYFEDTENFDLHLKPGNVAIDNGSDAEEIPEYDLEGNERPHGNGYDIGAYEFMGDNVPVSGIGLTPEEVTIDIEESFQLSAGIVPEDASNQLVNWLSGDTTVVYVDDSGLVLGLTGGSAYIRATTKDGGYTDSCLVIVNQPNGDYNLALMKPITATAEDLPANPAVNLVNANTADDSRWSASGYPQSVEIDLGAEYLISSFELYTYRGRAYQYLIETKTADGEWEQRIDRSANTESTQPIADADSVQARYVRLTCSGASGYYGSWISLNELRVLGHPVPASAIELSTETLELEEYETDSLSAVVLPDNATFQSVIWTSENDEIATINADGIVMGIAAGNTRIFATSKDGQMTAICNVAVNKIYREYLIDENFTADIGDFTLVSGGEWNFVDGEFVLTAPGNNSAGLLGNLAIHNTVIEGDFELSTLLKITGTSSAWNDAAVVFNYQDEQNFYYIALNESNDGNTMGIFKVVDNVPTELYDLALSVEADTWYELKVIRIGSSITVFLEDEQIAFLNDDSFQGGQVGYGSKNDGASFDDLLVAARSLNSLSPATPHIKIDAPSPTMKIYPNPCSEPNITLEVSKGDPDSDAIIRIYDYSGRVLVVESFQLEYNGSMLVTLNVESLDPGFYIFVLYNGPYVDQKKLVIQ